MRIVLQIGIHAREKSTYVTPVRLVLVILIALALLATLGVLFAGVITLGQENHDPKKSNVLMRWRIVLQGTALLLLALLFLVSR